MAMPRRCMAVVFCIAMCLANYALDAQKTAEEIHAALTGQPLYLRGLWIGNKLEFDGAGHLSNMSEPGPMTLSGIDVQNIWFEGKNLLVQARRIALVENGGGRLERQAIYSTTKMDGSLRRSPNNKYIAYREVELLVRPDDSGDFGPALRVIFANGFSELASSAPPYWACYAEGYFARSMALAEARKTVAACVEAHTLSKADPQRGDTGPGFTAATVVSSVQPRVTDVAAELGVHGVSHIRFTVSQHGVPLGFQIMRAVGGGMDEEVLRTISKYHFQPARRNGTPVPADFDINLVFENQP